MATLAYNSKCHSSTGQTPFLAWMGREAKLPIDLIVPTPHQQYETVEQHTEDVLRRFHQMFSQMKANNEAVFRRNARLYSGNLHDYKVYRPQAEEQAHQNHLWLVGTVRVEEEGIRRDMGPAAM